MSGVQGIIVSGEASESDEEEEFCATTAKEQLVNKRPHGGEVGARKQYHTQEQFRRMHDSLLHQKLWETNISLERNLTQCFQGPLTEDSRQISRLSGSLPAAQTATLSAHSALAQSRRNLSHLNFLLAGLKDNPLALLKET
ncbi:hypothetical protein Pcinc_019158 [Petrolisthes cinctipes]|uniref:Biogenesis of lysosome-related organelles complex 1 subunit 3 n=1 Tax=Petrolisthes cinctipes TaxID=88211 RepID=A0AAE1BVC9_PETCI|nr:hypothetical protein Pcinc_036830 [Petrolisthes cinctipes]KAK3876019.1 hypothetical protein Pcinc_019158 [Petrolisthes cinctipes]